MNQTQKNILRLTLQKQTKDVKGFFQITESIIPLALGDDIENQKFYLKYQQQQIQLHEEIDENNLSRLLCKGQEKIQLKFSQEEWTKIQNYIIDKEENKQGIQLQLQHIYEIQNKKGQKNQIENNYSFFILYQKFLNEELELEGQSQQQDTEQSQQITLKGILQFDQKVFIERNKEQTYKQNVTELEKNMQIKNVLVQLVGMIKDTCMQICQMYLKQTNALSGNYDEFKKFNAFTEQQKIKLLNQKKYTFFKDFLKQHNSQFYKQKFFNIVQKLYFDSVDKNFLNTEKKSEAVYSHLQVLLSKITNHVIVQFFENEEEQIPLALKYYYQHIQQQNYKIQESSNYQEDLLDQRLREFEKVGFFYEAEQILLNRVQNQEKIDFKCWFSLTQYYIRRQNYELAETCLQKILLEQKDNNNYKQIQACFYYRRKKFQYFQQIIQDNLRQNKWSIIDNLLMSHFLSKIQNKEKLSQKYYNVAKKKFLHNKQAQKRNPSLQELNIDENIWKELIIFLFQNCLEFLLEEIIEDRIHTQQSFKNLILGNVYSMRQNMKQSNCLLDKVLDDKQISTQYYQEALLTKACNLYFMNYHYDSELLFLDFLQKADKTKLYDILLIMGFSYCQRKAYLEAYQVFQKLKDYNNKSLLVWIGLSLTCINLNFIDQAEESLSAACRLDPFCSTIWGYIIQTNFKKAKNDAVEKIYIKKLNNIYQNLEIYDLTLAIKISKQFKDIQELDIALQLQQYSFENMNKYFKLKQNQEINWLVENKKIHNIQFYCF